ETAEGIRVAEEDFQTWEKVSVPVRGRYLFKLHHLLMTNKEELARLITLENGKSLSESLGEVQRGIENVEHAASITNLIMGDSLSTAATDIEITNYRYPIGVV
ncbi:aldehyde dehydrogenase family protein, partial [Klebsiella michiganensis]|uniref:aldehyde dehydrogenase family protein n=1 Tax=Klebsiella michiganensis TaxID=1134687 RepID=UPI0012B775A3